MPGVILTYAEKLVKEGKMPANQLKFYNTFNEGALLPEQADSMVQDLKKEFDPTSKPE